MSNLWLVFVTAALTALATTLVKDWLPSVVKTFFARLRRTPVMVVQVKDGRRPVQGVSLIAEAPERAEEISSGVTDEHGIARLLDMQTGLLVIQALHRPGPSHQWTYSDTVEITSLPYALELDLDDFGRAAPPPEAVAPAPSLERTPSSTPDAPDRRSVDASLRIDWVEGFLDPYPMIEAFRVEGLSVVDIFRELGLELRLVPGECVPSSIIDGALPITDEMLMEALRRLPATKPEDPWRLYGIAGGTLTRPGVDSMMFDIEARGGFWVGGKTGVDPRQFVWACVHEAGHQLNLPHPWQAYGDTRSVMSMFYRWPDWAWDEPSVFRFDAFGVDYVRSGPEQYVRPGASSFMDYGGPQPWKATATSPLGGAPAGPPRV